MTRSTSVLLLSLLFACNTTESPIDDETPEAGDSSALDCDRLEVLVDQACESVEVSGVETRDFSFARAGWTLEGTLWYPQVSSPDYQPPGVVLVHGSGPNGRESLVPGSLGVTYAEPIPVLGGLAQALAERGFAVLSYDKRTCFVEARPECPHSYTEYPGDLDAIRVDDFLEDARSAANALAAEPDVADDILIIGHSQGASFVPILATEEDVIHGGVMLAGAMLPIPESIEGQYDDFADWLEISDPGNPSIAELRMEADEARAILDAIAAGTYPEPEYLGGSVEFWRSWMDIQAAFPAQLEALEEPIAAYFGEFDFNIGPAHVEQLQSWIEAGLVDAELRTYPDLTHAFVYVTDEPPGHTSEFATEVVDDLVTWAVGRP